MALIECPECGRKNVSDTAQACPECGFNIREFLETQKSSKADTYKALVEEEEPSGVSGMFQTMMVRMGTEKLVKSAISRLSKDLKGRMLFSGFGRGAVVEALIKRTACTVQVIDISEEHLNNARKWNLSYIRGGRLHLECSLLTDFSGDGGKYSAAIVVNPGQYEGLASAFTKLGELLEEDALLLLCLVKNAGKGASLEEVSAVAEQNGFRVTATVKSSEGTVLEMRKQP